MSHDWPRGIYKFGNAQQLLKFKPFFREDIENDKLGSPSCQDLLKHLQPQYWFSAHLHCQFSAVVPHEDNDRETKFLALDKCLPKRRFLQILDVDSDSTDLKLSYDLEWLTILHLTKHLISVKSLSNYMPGPGSPCRWNFTPTDEEKELVLKKFDNNLLVPMNFCRTVEPYNPSSKKEFPQQQKAQVNPQTTTFCDTLDIDDPSINNDSVASSIAASDSSFNTTSEVTPMKRKSLMDSLPPPQGNTSLCNSNPDELNIDDDDIDSPLEEQSSFLDASIIIEETSEIRLAPQCDVVSTLTEIASDSVPENVIEAPAKKFKRRNQSIYGMSDEV